MATNRKALEYLTRAQALTVEFGNDEERAQILQAMGVAYADLNKHEDALRNLRESLEIKRKLGLKKGMAMSLDAMASSEDVLGKSGPSAQGLQRGARFVAGIGRQSGNWRHPERPGSVLRRSWSV